MNAKILSESKRVTVEKYSHDYKWRDDPHAGFGFPCTKEGELIDWAHKTAIWTENYEFCVTESAKPDGKVIDMGIVDESYSYREPALARCVCGEEFYLRGDSMGEVGCPKCDRVYNIFGQRLKGFTYAFAGQNEYGEYYDESY